ncbi:hypothetical protein GWK47_002917 [Chionoecetes opilio]|uniref:Uncharacterized protein n=1 Tax=Chionoecetes opilio TaxID=41210 RepID=A0A8J4XPA4_CHIOP|nr:hypothetical protein GWK47_002917 [Chionoecetes opilio]
MVTKNATRRIPPPPTPLLISSWFMKSMILHGVDGLGHPSGHVERQYLESRVGVMVDRAKQVKRACRNAPPSGNRFPQVIWDQVHGVVWCPNYKFSRGSACAVIL